MIKIRGKRGGNTTSTNNLQEQHISIQYEPAQPTYPLNSNHERINYYYKYITELTELQQYTLSQYSYYSDAMINEMLRGTDTIITYRNNIIDPIYTLSTSVAATATNQTVAMPTRIPGDRWDSMPVQYMVSRLTEKEETYIQMVKNKLNIKIPTS